MIARTVLYHGHVQGVGFRQTSLGIARAFAVNGYVKNLAGGTVEIRVEGDELEVDRFLQALSQRLAHRIDHVVTQPSVVEGFEHFTIQY